MSRIHWTKEELNTVAKEYVRRFPDFKPTWGYILRAQTILPPERQRKTLMGAPLDEFRARVTEIKTAIESRDETTASLIQGEVRSLEAFTAGEPVPPPPATARPLPPMVLHDEPSSPHPSYMLPVERIYPEPWTVDSSPLDRLIAILREVTELNRMSGHDLLALTRNSLETRRLVNLTIQATNGLSYFEEALTLAANN